MLCYGFSIARAVNTASSYLQFHLRVGIIGVAYLVGMSTYTLGAIVVGLLTDKLVSEYSYTNDTNTFCTGCLKDLLTSHEELE